MNFNTRELTVRDNVIKALNSSLFLPQVLEATRTSMLEFVQADAMALCLMHTEPFDFRWLVPGPRIPILDGYVELVKHDFLRAPIMARPNVPIRDTQLLSRGEYERTIIYQRSRELDSPLEHIMAVLLPIRAGLVGALAFYRNEPRPFSSQNASAVTSLNEHLMNMVRNVSDAQNLMTGANLLDELYRRDDSAFLVVEHPIRETFRSKHAATLLARWFTASDLDSSGIPRVFKERLDALVGMDADARRWKLEWVVNHSEGIRKCRFIELPTADGPQRWALVLNEIPHSIPLPLEMAAKLTRREVDVATYMLRNWDNDQIAGEIGRKVLTVKTHVRNIFFKLKVDDRADFLYQAARLNRPV